MSGRAVVRRAVERWGDPAVALVLALLLVLAAVSEPRADQPVTALLAVAAGGVLALRRRLPAVTAVLELVCFAGLDAAAPALVQRAVLLLVALSLALYSAGRHARGWEAWVGPAVVAATVVVLELGDGDGSASGVFFYLIVAGSPWAVGLAVRLGVDRVREQRARTAALEAEGERAVAEERTRIARELHDVVAHAIAVTVLQARGAAALVGTDDAGVRRALGSIERINTAALGDMRRLLVLLRSADGDDAGLEPAPGLDRLPDLIEQVRGAGLPVDLVVHGEPLPVTPGLELAAYRVVQEGLTNALHHGGPGAGAVVVLGYDEGALRVEVRSTGIRAPVVRGPGHGLAGLRERVELGGGRFSAGPRRDGWLVSATLPHPVAVPA